jgi:hypothetical protein
MTGFYLCRYLLKSVTNTKSDVRSETIVIIKITSVITKV